MHNLNNTANHSHSSMKNGDGGTAPTASADGESLISTKAFDAYLNYECACIQLLCKRVSTLASKLTTLKQEREEYSMLGMQNMCQDLGVTINKLMEHEGDDKVAIETLLDGLADLSLKMKVDVGSNIRNHSSSPYRELLRSTCMTVKSMGLQVPKTLNGLVLTTITTTTGTSAISPVKTLKQKQLNGKSKVNNNNNSNSSKGKASSKGTVNNRKIEEGDASPTRPSSPPPPYPSSSSSSSPSPLVKSTDAAATTAALTINTTNTTTTSSAGTTAWGGVGLKPKVKNDDMNSKNNSNSIKMNTNTKKANNNIKKQK